MAGAQNENPTDNNVVMVFLSSCASIPSTNTREKQYSVAQKTYPYVVKITDFYGAAGYGFDYCVSENSVVVVLWNDFGSSPKEVLNRSLTQSEKNTWRDFLRSFRIDTLKDEYDNPNMFDGLQRRFSFHINDEKKEIVLRNRHVPELFALSAKINEFLPKEVQMRGGGSSVRVVPKN